MLFIKVVNIMKMKRLMVYLIIICCIFGALVFAIYLSKVNKYRMTEDEIEQYEKALAEYEETTSDIIFDIGGVFPKQYDEAVNKSDCLYNHIVNLKNEYMSLIEIEFPNKYTEMYKQLVYTNCVLDISNDLAYATFDPILDKNVGEYFPPNEIGWYTHKLEKQLENPYYIPSDIFGPNFEQILYKIQKEYLESNKSASEIYDELHDIFYNEEFIEDLK